MILETEVLDRQERDREELAALNAAYPATEARCLVAHCCGMPACCRLACMVTQ